jgi:glycosyltransferase involved in cell wall biosynthesis
MPFCNAAATLPECLESIRAQSFAEFELVAVDDGSDDDSAAIVRNFAAADPRIRLIEPGKIGLVMALNLGVAGSRASLIARMDADDIMHRERLEAQVSYLREHADVSVVGCQVELFPAHHIRAGYREYVRWQNACVTPAEIEENLYVESPFAHPSVVFHRDVFLRLNGYAHGPFPEDYDLWLRMASAGCLMAKVPRVLLQWRERPDRLSRVDPRYSRDSFDRLRARFLARDPRLQNATEIVIWGAGRETRLRVRHLLELGIQPDAWIDIDPRKIGKTLAKQTVHPPEWLNRTPRPFVLAYVTNHGARDQIAERLELMGYRCGLNYLAVG